MKRLVLFAHYDADDQLKRYVLHYLAALRRVCDRIHFVSTAALADAELAKARPLCAEAWCQENIGFDFAMWSEALARVDVAAWDEIVLTNSSVFGPVAPLEAAFARMADSPADLWGLTECYEIAPHLQSYFLVFRRRLLGAPEFRRFWSGILPYRDKWQVIRSYEVGLSTFFAGAGFRLAALIPLSRLWSADGPCMVPFFQSTGNPVCRVPLALLEHGLPFVKVEVLRDNPEKVSLARVREVMRAGGYDLSLVEFDQRMRSQKRGR